MAATLATEKVHQARQINRGTRIDVVEDKFWIAYAPHVAAYGATSDRIARATGTGKTCREALANAEAK